MIHARPSRLETSVRILVPAKCEGGKTRLAPLMQPSARERLCLDFVKRTLGVALPVAPTIVIARDMKSATEARALGADVLFEPEASLNAALEIGRASVGAGHGILVCPIDLPHLTSETLRRLIANTDAIAVAPDRHRSGTNLLWLPAAAATDFQFMFGPASFARHVERGRRLGFVVETPDIHEAGFDIDNPDDFAIWRECVHA